MKTQLIIDWISITSHGGADILHNATHPKLLQWDEWDLCSAKNGYTEGANHKTGVKVYKNDARSEMGTHIIYSGKTLQRLSEQYDLSASDILSYHVRRRDNIARLDVALDIIQTNLTVQMFINEYDEGRCITPLKSASEIKEKKGGDGHTFYIGSTKKRKKLIRIYDKRAETNTAIPWIRIEFQIMGKPATQLALKIQDGHTATIILSALKSIVDFPRLPSWRYVFQDVHKINIVTATDKLGKTREWLQSSVFVSLQKEAELDPMWFDEYITALLVAVRGNKR